MSRIEKTVFISYRRSSGSAWALAISQNLTHHGYDVFFDYQGLASGDFAQNILENIMAHAHFLVLLTPSALKRIDEPGDWMRREIEAALEHRRNIVPVMLQGFSFSTPSIGKRLTGTLAPLKSYNGLEVAVRDFDHAMEQLRTRYLNVSIEAVLHPASAAAKVAATEQRVAADAAPIVPRQELTAARWFERGYDATDLQVQLECYSEAIRLKPDFSEAYNNRGIARHGKGDLDGALADFAEAIRLTPDDPDAYSNRGNIRRLKGDLDGALADFAEALRLKPDYADAYNNRGNARGNKGDLDGALADFAEALRLKPNYAEAYYNRGSARRATGDLDGALADFAEAIRLKPDDADAYNNRAIARRDKGDLEGALADYGEAIRLRPDYADAYYNRGNLRHLQGDLDSAEADYTEALQLKRDYADAYRNRGYVRHVKGDVDGALADLAEAIRLVPDWAEAAEPGRAPGTA